MPASAPPALPSFSTAEVARRLGVSIPTVQRWVDLGYLRAWKTVGGHRRIDARSVERLAAEQARVLQPAAPAGPRVLVVDDNPDDRDLLGALVEEAFPGASVAVAENGFEALVLIGRAMPDVLVTDILMPHMNGVEMLRHVAQLAAARPALMVAVSSRTPRQFAKLGALPPDVMFFAKPLHAGPFVEALRAAWPAREGY